MCGGGAGLGGGGRMGGVWHCVTTADWMNEMMEGWRAERKNGMVQSEPVTVIPPCLPPSPPNPRLKTVAAGPVLQRPDFTAANQPHWELYSRLKSWLRHRWIGMWMEGASGRSGNIRKGNGDAVWKNYSWLCGVSLFVSLQLENARRGRYKTN